MKKIIKNFFEKIIYLFFSTTNKTKITNTLKNYDIISFDVFDTLIKRNVYDEKDIFKIVEQKYNKLYSNITDFYKKRIDAEKKSRILNNNNEITLEDIYLNIEYSKEKCEILKKLEIETELELCVANPDFIDIYNFCLKNKKNIYIISDMYLSKDIIEKILKKNGIEIYDEIYVSSEYNLKKVNGTIFKYIINKNNIKNKMIHLGDNPIADYIMPKLNGIKAILIKKKNKKISFYGNKISNKCLDYNIMMSSINNLNFFNSNYIEKKGICILSPLLYGFCIELHKYLIENKIEKYFFIARDSKIILDVYLKMYPEDSKKCKYINFSRKSVIFPTFSKNITVDEFAKKADAIIKRKKIYEIIDVLELNIDMYIKDFVNSNININAIFDELDDIEKNTFFDIIKEDFQIFCNNQRSLFYKYLVQNSFTGNICLIDIGWKGTIQSKINEFCRDNDIENNVFGFYMGIYENSIKQNGYIYNGMEKNKYKIYSSVGFFEILFLNNEGTTLYYKEIDNKISPVKGKYEQDEEITKTIDYVHCKSIQIIGKMNSESQNFNSKYAFYNYNNIIVNPSNKFINMLKKVNFSDGEIYTLIGNKTLFYYIFNMKKLKNDLINSYYKIGFLKNLFKIKFPYNFILEKLYKTIKGEK